MTDLLAIGFGGFLGSISRYFIFVMEDKLLPNTIFPFGTLIANLAGSFLIGVTLGLSIKFQLLSKGSFWYFLFVIGFLGAFTTFSTFSKNNLLLLIEKHYFLFILNIFLNIFLGLFLVAIGYFVVKR